MFTISTQSFVPVVEVRNNLAKYIQKVKKTKQPILIAKNGKVVSVMISPESLDEILELQATDKKWQEIEFDRTQKPLTDQDAQDWWQNNKDEIRK